MQGGAAGAIIVEGIQSMQPVTVGLRERVLIIRDQFLPDVLHKSTDLPSADVSINDVPVLYPTYVPAHLYMNSGRKEFCRIVSVSAKTILDLQLRFDSVPQVFQLTALDGVPVDGCSNQVLIPASLAFHKYFVAVALSGTSTTWTA